MEEKLTKAELSEKLSKTPYDLIEMKIDKVPHAVTSKESGKFTLAYNVNLFRKYNQKFLGQIELTIENILE